MQLHGVRCPHCETLQLAQANRLGLTVVCSKCRRRFVASDETGLLAMVLSEEAQVESVGFDRCISAAFFSYGISIPSALHSVVLSHLSVSLNVGETCDVLLDIGGMTYSIQLRYFQNNKKELCLHFLWTSNLEVKRALATIYSEAYEHFIGRGDKTFVKNWKVHVALALKEDSFVLDEDNFGSHGVVNSRLALKRKSSKQSIEIEDLLR